MPDLLQLTTDAQVTPAGVLGCHAHDQFTDGLHESGAADAVLVRVGVVGGYQLAVPSEDRVGRDDSSDLVEQSSTEWFALGCEAAALIVGQARSLVALEFSEDAVLLQQVGDQSRLITVDEARERDEEQLEGEVAGHVAESSAFKWPM